MPAQVSQNNICACVMHVCAFILSIYLCLQDILYIYIYIYTDAHTNIGGKCHLFTYSRTCTSTLRTKIHTYMHTYIYIYTHTHIYIHTQTGEKLGDAARRAGLNVPYGCKQGVCGTCEAVQKQPNGQSVQIKVCSATVPKTNLDAPDRYVPNQGSWDSIFACPIHSCINVCMHSYGLFVHAYIGRSVGCSTYA
jgi:hypothetical protein